MTALAGSAVALVALAVFGLVYQKRQSDGGLLSRQAERDLKEANRLALQSASANQAVRAADKNDYLWGKLSAPVKLIVYSDFDCPFCRQYYDTLKKARSEFGNKVVIVWRHFPLDSHPNGLTAAAAFDCARAQTRAEEMMVKLFDNQAENNNNVEEILNDAVALGLKRDRFRDCLTGEKLTEKILSQKAEAKTFGVIGTPTSFLNGRPLAGAYQFEDFTDQTGQKNDGLKTLIEQELKK